ncbi:MAG: Pyrophosphate--fructose 6-phosphate 1-phosphotransferase [Chlamydiae bacterium]|nr:Pyrophosphate--fructose 6-phosphate 1-phosphotransferase [Chlamydiota bacterium]
MKLNPLNQALLQKSIERPKLLTHLNEVEFIAKETAVTPKEVTPYFEHIKDLPYLKLKPQKRKDSSPKIVGVVFSGGQAPGGHNVIWGLYEALKKINSSSKLLGFLGGPSGLLDERYIEITKELLDKHRNLGGFNMIGSGRTKIASPDQLKQATKVAKHLNLDGFVIIGGDDSNTNAAILAQHFKENNCKTAVAGVPKTIDGDLHNDYIEISFGFDTACKLYSELIGNILTDAISAKKYYHFIKLMGRSASHIALECALQTRPNLVFIGEEILKNKTCLSDIIDEIANMVIKRSEKGKDYGVVLIPEGLIDFIPSFKLLNDELNSLLAHNEDLNAQNVSGHLSEKAKDFFELLPSNIQQQLMLDRDPHGNIQLAKIETHKLLIEMTAKRLDCAKKSEQYFGKFNPLPHYFGYEGRCANPTCFDAEYTYALGAAAATLIQSNHSGYIACVKGLKGRAKDWDIYGIPITSLMNIEHRHGKDKAVIKKALVETEGAHFKMLEEKRSSWLIEDHYNAPGPIQYFGDAKICESRNHILELS